MLTQSRVKELFIYDPDSGNLLNKIRRANRTKLFSIAGCINHDGYIRIRIADKSYMAHRIVWLYMYGELPTSQIDHINGNPADNRLTNLRLSTNSENRQNLRKAHKNNTSGLLGVSKNGNNWKSTIKINGKIFYLGTYKTKEQAHAVYLENKRKLHHACTI